jgi:uncharacterized protein YjbI with pentapeptide repeats
MPLLLPTKERISSIWKAAVRLFEHGRQWLIPGQQAAFFLGGGVIVLLLLIFSGVTAAVAAAAAWIALIRHFAQTDADRQRRITESYSKAVEQLASDKMEMRLGGIYTLERISRESPDDYWTVMETLAAFVREHASWKEPTHRISERAYFLWQEAGRPDGRDDEHWREAAKTTEPTLPATDVAAVLKVIVRRDTVNRKRERQDTSPLQFDLAGTDLRGANLATAHLENTELTGSHLEHANLIGAHLQWTNFQDAHLERACLQGADLAFANLEGAHLEGAKLLVARLVMTNLHGARLQGADLTGARLVMTGLRGARLEGANLTAARLEDASLAGAHLEGANLTGARLNGVHLLDGAIADAKTRLPDACPRPPHWPAYEP